MLVLTRKIGERIIIGSDIEVVVLKAAGNRVRIGINAPTEVPVLRAELPRRADLHLQNGALPEGFESEKRDVLADLVCLQANQENGS